MAFDPNHHVNVGPRGTFHASGDHKSSPEGIDALVDAVKASGKKRVAIYFHGGLNREAVGLKIAQGLKKDVFDKTSSYPVFFIWETGLLETAQRSINEILVDSLLKKLYEKVLKRAETWVKDKFSKGSNDMPLEQELQAEFELEIHADPVLADMLAKEPIDGRLGGKEPSPEGGVGQKGIDIGMVAKVLAAVAWRTFKRFRAGRDHGVHATVVEEFLREVKLSALTRWIWSSIKRQANEIFAPNAGLAGDDQHVGTYFLAKLSALQKQDPSIVIDLVGHSAGSITICHFLASGATPATPIKVRNVALLAPACTHKLFHDEVVAPQPPRCERVRIFNMSDEVERNDVLVPVVYPHSLLYFVSGVCEEEVDAPLLGMARFVDGKGAFKEGAFKIIREWLATGDRQVLSITKEGAAAGLMCSAKKHGDFDENPLTQASLIALIEAA